jgi:glycosyltransferase involved in cell wall biosynthesis
MDKDMITILDPELIAQSQDIIQSLAREGLNHLTSDPKLGWNYVLDNVWVTKQMAQYIAAKKQQCLAILDVGCGRSRFHNFLEKRLGINIIGIDRPQGYCHQAQSENIDYYVDFLQLDAFPENSVDIIYWLSAIEHNEKEKIRQLFQKSMSLLKEGGLFLATFAVSEKTHWFQDSEQTNLSIADSMDIFDVDDVEGNLQSVKDKYRKNTLLLRDKYERRYLRFGLSAPEFVVGAVSKTKVKLKAKDLPLKTIPQNQPYIYLFVPSNDTHVHWMYPLAKALEKSCFMVISEKNERADFCLENLGEKFLVYKSGILEQINPDVIVFGCDWAKFERQVIREAKALGIQTVCIQEGCLNFADEHSRMLHADYAFLQGPVMRKYIRKENNVFVTGNPKYDSLHEMPLPDKPMVMINSNFTYGIFEDARDQWVRDVAETCKNLGLDFFISQHPRDKGVFPSEYKIVKSDAFKLHQQLEKTSILVSRFSTVIYEAAAMGREVVYYNPHHEPFRIFTEDNTGGIWHANNPSELVSAIILATRNLGKNRENRNKFLSQHCGTLDHDATERCVRELQAIAERHTGTFSFNTKPKVQTNQVEGSKLVSDWKPKFSIVMPNYNNAKYITEAIESVLNQSFKDWELIIVEDCSTDNSLEIINRYLNDKRIRLIRHEGNQGYIAALKSGIANVKSEYFGILDSDDCLMPSAVETMHLQHVALPDVGLIYSQFMCCHEDLRPRQIGYGAELRPGKTNLEKHVVSAFRTFKMSDYLKTSGYDEDILYAEDRDITLKMEEVTQLKFVDQCLYLYRELPHSQSHDPKKMFIGRQSRERARLKALRRRQKLLEKQKADIQAGLARLESIKLSAVSEKKDQPNFSGVQAKPLVSIIIPAYNAAEYIAEAIESVLIQNYRNFELLIINDGSTDGTEEIIRGFKDERIRYFRQENQGLAATHNTGIRQSRGEFIIKLDADDKMTPDFIARHVRQFENNPEADLVYCDDYLIDQNDKPIRIITRPQYADRKLLIRDMFRCGYPIVPFRTCIRKSVFDKIGFFDESLAVGEDYDMMRRFVRHGLRICHLPGALYLRRMTENSLSRNLTPQKAKCQFDLVKRFTETFGYDELFPDVEWDEIPADQRQLNAKCLAVTTYLAIGQDYLNVHSTGLYANVAFEHACSELSDCLKIDPDNRQIRELLQKCELGRQRYEKHVRQAVC